MHTLVIVEFLEYVKDDKATNTRPQLCTNIGKEGTITKEEAKHHPKKNMLTKALGCNAFVEPDVMVRGFQKKMH